MRKIILFSALCLILFACGESKEAKLEAQKWQTVMEQHDIVMPMMSDINKTKKGLKALLASSDNLTATDSTQIQMIIADLDKADEGMMDWMNGFQQLEKLQQEKTHAEIISYLDNQDKTIQQVGKDMSSSIKAGKAFLEGR